MVPVTQQDIETIAAAVQRIRDLTQEMSDDAIADDIRTACDDIDLAAWGPRVITDGD